MDAPQQVDVKSTNTVQQLPIETAQRLVAGPIVTEVVGVVKELVENALDAQASNITVRLVEGGLDTIMVKDNGIGIAIKDHHLVGQQYCTSKLRHTTDLDQIRTFGFRGEVIHSLCTTSHVTIITRVSSESMATLIELDACGKINKSHLTSGETGTSVIVQNVFGRLPVRRKLAEQTSIKSIIGCVTETLRCYAFTNTNIHFNLRYWSHGVHKEWTSTGDGVTTQAKVATLLGKTVADHLRRVEWRDNNITITALLPQIGSDPTYLYTTQSPAIYINGRPMKIVDDIRNIERAVRQAYSNTFNGKLDKISNKSLFMFMQLEMPTNMYDVNIVPSKDRVLFRDPKTLMDSIYRLLDHVYSLDVNYSDDDNTQDLIYKSENNIINTPPKKSSLYYNRSFSMKKQKLKKNKFHKSQWTTKSYHSNTKHATPPSPISPIQQQKLVSDTDSRKLIKKSPGLELSSDNQTNYIQDYFPNSNQQIQAHSTVDSTPLNKQNVTNSLFWQCPNKESPLYTRKMTEDMVVDWQQVKINATAYQSTSFNQYSVASDSPRIIGQSEDIWFGVHADGLVAIRLARENNQKFEQHLESYEFAVDTTFPEPIILDASMVGGEAAYQLLSSLESQPTFNSNERRITDKRIIANGFDLRQRTTTLMLHGICSALLPDYGISDFRELAQLLVDQQQVDGSGKRLFPCKTSHSMLRFCRPKRVIQFLKQLDKNNDGANNNDAYQRKLVLEMLHQNDGIQLGSHFTNPV
ncbi:hypothetical protein BDF19DRAFT_416692 [Syncephalis fuscata]|nr:hypothetical protein BDF19DRAFT_416692 [Syncephalis fuscata]